MKVLAISGSLKQASIHSALLKAAEIYLPEHADLTFASIDLPLYNEEIDGTVDASYQTPNAVQHFRQAVCEADVILIASPEYNHSVSGPLKNAIDWASRPAFDSPLKAKKMALLSCSPGPVGGARGQAHLRTILASTLSEVYPGMEYLLSQSTGAFNEQNVLTDENAKRRLKRFIEEFIEWAS